MGNVKRIDGTLSGSGEDVIKVSLDITPAAALMGQAGVEDEAVERAELVSRNIVDGDYVLDYFFYKHYRQPVRVTNGRFHSR